jgi:hypothetical protein
MPGKTHYAISISGEPKSRPGACSVVVTRIDSPADFTTSPIIRLPLSDSATSQENQIQRNAG